MVGGIPTPLKNMKVNWDHDIPNMWKVIKFMFQTTSINQNRCSQRNHALREMNVFAINS
jgi:hypothetical protein